jgi:glycosyltransferase involved in cell wall biosynthesis
MKIVFIGCRSFNNIGGIESYMLNMCSSLTLLGIHSVLYIGSDYNMIEKMHGFTVIHKKIIKNKYLNKIMIGLVSTFSALKNHWDADIYHFNANPVGFFSFLPLFFGKKTVFQGHGFEWRRKKWSPVIRFFTKLLDYFVLFINKNILMCSQEQVDYVEKIFPGKNVMLLPGGVVYPPVQPSLQASALFTKKKYILFLGRIVWEKRCDLLLNAFQAIQKDIDCDLVIAGPVEDERIVSGFRNNDRIHFLGPVFGDEKYACLINSLVYVIPSDLEGLSISLLEAMSYGCLCVASDILANKEALADTGLYFKAGDGNGLGQILYETVIHNKKYNELRIKAQNRIESFFDWKIISAKAFQYYQSL